MKLTSWIQQEQTTWLWAWWWVCRYSIKSMIHGKILTILWFIYFWLHGYSLLPRLFSSWDKRGCSQLVCRLLITVASPVAERGLQGRTGLRRWTRGLSDCGSLGSSTGSIVGVHGLSCSTTGSSQARDWTSLLHGQGDSLPVSYQRSPKLVNRILLKLKTSAQWKTLWEETNHKEWRKYLQNTYLIRICILKNIQRTLGTQQYEWKIQ